MKALRWYDKGDLRVDHLPMPSPAPDEVLVKVRYSGICGSEVHEYIAGPLFIPLEPHPLTGCCAPQTMGHEFGGHVWACGSEVRGLEPGTPVTINPMLSCGRCRVCRRGRPGLCETLAYYGVIGDGGHAEYAVVKAANCVPLPPDAPLEYAAFAEPAGVAYHAVNQGQVGPGSTVLVLGGGPIGQLVAQYARAAGAEKVFLTEIATRRVRLAQSIGAVDEVFNPLEVDVREAVLERTQGEGVDCAIECCGGARTGMLEDTVVQAVALTRPEGLTVIVGTFSQASEFHFNSVVFTERRIVGSWTWHAHAEFSEAVRLIVEGRIRVMPLISKRIPLEQAVTEGILALHLGREDHLKILIDHA